MFLNTTDTYAMLQPFGSIEQLNANTSAIRAQYKTELTPAAREVLDVIHRYASKYYGVCYLAKAEIARMIGVSKRTVIRACQLLEALGCIVQYETKRVNGDKRQSTNAIVFLTQLAAKDAFVQECEQMADNMQEETQEDFQQNPVDKTDVTPHVTPNTLPIKAPKTKTLKEYTYADAGVPPHKPSMYAKIKEFVSRRGLSLTIVSEFSKIMYGIVKKALVENPRLTKDQAESIALEGLSATFVGPVKTNCFAKLSGIIKRKFAELLAVENGEVMSDYEVAARRGKFRRIPQWLADQKGLTAEEQDRLEELNAKALAFGGKNVELVPEWMGEHKAEQSAIVTEKTSVSSDAFAAAQARLAEVLGR